ncbi:AraC family transcriptional regulator [Halarcobacter bivalviorum]|uniref:AraC family transcriptional regulator n=1 Tax=Halarcobacter bivalviorum TaxID=663364 RepID=UPI001D17FD9A|nr:AraC family transcriptional regulator [Halarcobacter bivalviorum]
MHKALPYLELRHSNTGNHYKEHIHESFSIGINLKGESLYSNKQKKYDFKKGLIAVVNPNEIHSCNALKRENHEYYMLYLDKKWCFEIQKTISNHITSFIEYPNALIDDQNYYKDFLNLCKLLFSNSSIEEKENELIEFFTKLFEKNIPNSKEKIEDENFEKICKYLKENFKENISLEELAKKFSLNSFYIIKLFKANMNMTPHKYLLNIKINYSKELLKKGETIVNAALECGFVDQSHFHKNFLNIVATTPNQYRKNFI